jgi:hypothetical protein
MHRVVGFYVCGVTTMAPAATRTQLVKKLRFEVFKRDGFRCMYCGATPDKALLQCDHIHPVALGGRNEIDNLVTSCQPCNAGKSATPLTVVPASLEDRALETMEREEQIAMYQAIMRSKRSRIEDEACEVADVFCQIYGTEGIPMKDFYSIKMFIEKIGWLETMDAAERAVTKRPNRYEYKAGFTYFCGVCWGKHRDRGGL